jgi:HK97 family phage major capsid protein
VGEGKPKPVSAMAFDLLTLGWTKVAGIVPVTEELFRFSNPAIEALVRDSLLQAVALLTDHDFLDPSKAAVVGVSPASVTNAVTPITPTGTTGDNLRADLGSLISKFAAANMNLAGLVLVMTSQQAVRISLMRTALGTVEFPGLGPTGGTLEGIPVITSENIVHTGASPSTGSLIVALNAPEILLADDGAVAVDMSREASLQMDSAPDDPTTASTVMISLWQRNMVALRAERMINWLKRRAGAVQYINGAAYA